MRTVPLPFWYRIINAVIPATLFGLLGAMVFFAPLAFGSVQFWSQQVLFLFAVIILAGLVAYIAWGSQSRFIWMWCYVPIALFLGLVLLQIADVPISWLRWVSPATVSTKQSILQSVAANQAALDHGMISFYAWPTLHQAYLIFIVASVFLATIHLCQSVDAIKKMLCLMAVSGAVVAGVALYQNFSGSKTFLGLAPIPSNSGPFVSHSHFGQFMNLSIGAMLALLLVRLAEVSSERITARQVIRQLWHPRLRVIWILFITIVISMTTIFLSLTRGGVIGMVIAAACTFGALHLANRGVRNSLPALLSVGVLVALLCFGFDAVYERLVTLRQIELVEGGRMMILKDSLPTFFAFPLLGTGLGTFEYVFPMYDRSNIPSLAAHAENEYAQLLFETGVTGLIIVASFFWLMAIRAWRTWRDGTTEPIHYAIYGLGYGVVAILIQSASDFGQHLPGVAIMTAVTFALIVSIGRVVRSQKSPAPSTESESRRAGLTRPWRRAVFGGLAILAIGLFATNGFAYFDTHRRAEAAWETAQRTVRVIDKVGATGTNEQYADLLEPMMNAVELAPENVKYRHGLNYWRWRAISRVRDPETGGIVLDEVGLSHAERIADESLQVALICPTFGAAHSLAGQIQYFVLGEDSGKQLITSERIADESLQVALSCPTFGAAHSLAGQIQYFVLGEDSGKQLITSGAELAGHNAEACFAAGIVVAQDGDKQSAQTWFEHAVARNRNLRSAVVEFLANDLADPQFAYHFAKDDRRLLDQLARKLQSDPNHAAFAASWLKEARAQLVKVVASQDASASEMVELAEVYRKEGDLDRAIELYRRALAMDYGQVHRHYALAKLLADAGKVVEAKQEARVCLQIRPEMASAKNLLAELATR